MRIRIMLTMIVALLLSLSIGEVTAQKKKVPDPLTISTQLRIPSDFIPGSLFVSNRIESWKPNETAIIICDMWDKHWCKGATARVAEMAPALNEILVLAREKGVTIVHAPSDCMDYYKDYPGRKKIAKYKDKKISELANGDKLPAEESAVWPVDQSDGGCDDDPSCHSHKAWTKQIDILTIQDNDLISDSGSEIGSYFKKKGIRNVILTGVHTNMCVIGRSFGLRAMKRMGMNVVLMRDMTDLMYNHRMAPEVDHFSGLDLIVEYIEKYVCPTIVSTDLTGKKQFRFKDDKRPRIAFVTAESEYYAHVRFPEFAHELTLKNIHSDFALGVPNMEGPGRHNLENLQILEDADLAVIFTRRRALEPEKMKMIKNYVASGRPLLGIRTASHAFDAKGNVPREGGGVVVATENTSDLLTQWPEFDRDILGGNYTGHYGHLKTGTDVKVVPGMENHPILKGVAPEFNSPSWLYKNRPLRTGKAMVLLLGTNPGVPDEPVMWINGKNVIYTSLGHWDDWKNESFRRLMSNTIDYLLNNPNK